MREEHLSEECSCVDATKAGIEQSVHRDYDNSGEERSCLDATKAVVVERSVHCDSGDSGGVGYGERHVKGCWDPCRTRPGEMAVLVLMGQRS